MYIQSELNAIVRNQHNRDDKRILYLLSFYFQTFLLLFFYVLSCIHADCIKRNYRELSVTQLLTVTKNVTLKIFLEVDLTYVDVCLSSKLKMSIKKCFRIHDVIHTAQNFKYLGYVSQRNYISQITRQKGAKSVQNNNLNLTKLAFILFIFSL